MKKYLAFLLCLVMVCSALAACGGTDTPVVEPSETEDPGTEPTVYDPAALGGGFAVNPLYFYTNMYCLKDGIENVLYTPFGYYFMMYVTGVEDMTACIASEPETIDPSLISSVDGSTYTQHQFEALMKYVSTGEPFGDDQSVLNTAVDFGMAESCVVSEDGLVYTFTLRDANWSDGVAVTAGDFVYAWQRIVNPETAADYGYILDGIVMNAAAIQAGDMTPDQLGIVALDDKTLEITLEAPCPYFMELCAFASLMPLRQDVVEEFGAEWTNPENIVTNGPMIISEWVHDSYIKMVPNPEYYNSEAIVVNSVTYYLSDSETAILSAYQSDEYQFIENFPSDMIESLKASGDCYILDYVGTYYLYINVDNVPDWRVRAAICLVTDRENIVENVTQGGQVPATGLVAAGITDSEGNNFAAVSASDIAPMWAWLQENYGDAMGLDLNEYEDRCELAVALVDAAVADGYDKASTIYYCYNTSDTHQAIAEAVQSDVSELLGLSFELTNQDWNVYTNGLAEGNFGLARLGWIADYNDPITYLELFAAGNSYNYSEWVSEGYTNLITEAKTLPGGLERDALLYAAELVLFSGGES